MSTYVPPKRATQFIFYVGLVSQADTKVFQSNPTIAAGDFKVSIDGGALANLTTLPTVDPAASKAVKITLSIAEMTGDNIQLICSDASGAEWCDLIVNIQTVSNQVDELALASQFTAALADSVPAAGDPASLNQAIYMILQFLTSKGLVGTTLTVTKPDGSTELMTFTLNSSTDPTSIVRAT